MPTPRVVVDHMTVGVTDLARSRVFCTGPVHGHNVEAVHHSG